MNEDFVGANALDDDKVVHVPMQNGRQVDMRKTFQRDADGSCGKADRFGHVHQKFQRASTARGAKAAAQFGKTNRVAVIIGDHRQRSEGAFARFRLAHHLDARGTPSQDRGNEHHGLRGKGAGAGAARSAGLAMRGPATASNPTSN
nr:hypothetical protein [Sphingobium xenophagum]